MDFRNDERRRFTEMYESNRRANRSRSKDAIRRYKQSKKRKSNSAFKIVGLLIAVIVIIVLATFSIARFIQYRSEKKEIESYSNVQMKQDIYLDFSVIGIANYLPLKGRTKQEVYDIILSAYDFGIKIYNSNPELDIFEMPKYGPKVEDSDYTKYFSKSSDNLGTGQEVEIKNPLEDITIKATKESYDFPDFLEYQLKNFIDDIYDKYLYINTNEFNKKNVDVNSKDFKADFKFEATTNDSHLDDYLSQLARLWDTKAVKGQIEGFDETKNEFTFGDDHKGYVVDQDELRKKIVDEVNKGNLKAEIWTILRIVDAEGPSVKSRYKYVSVYETWATDNEKRNNNISKACKGINGIIVKPGQEFSFNKKLGERTEERGYDYAPAYLEGQVVEELGGGICQVSTTLYNAIFGSGLTTTYRKSHTFEPSYITPGLDATVSFYGPDYKFINNSNYSVGIRASFAKQKVKVEIFAVPLLKEGQTQNLVSKKIQDMDYPTLSIIQEGKASKGSQGSEWQVFKVVKEGDKEVDRVFDHSAIYQGHTPTAFEEYTYVDSDGVLQTHKFVETKQQETSERRNTSITTARRNNTIQSIAPSENQSGVVIEISPDGNGSTGQPQ